MKKQLALTALAIAIAAPGVATATEVKVGGIVQIFYFADYENDADANINGADIRTQITASETVGGYTGYSSFRIDADGLSNDAKARTSTVSNATATDPAEPVETSDGLGLTGDSITVGVKNDSFDFQMGEVSKVQDLGRYAGDLRSFEGDLEEHIGITGSFGPVKVRAAYSPDGANNDDYTGLGLEFNAGVVTVGVNAQNKGDDDEALTVGVKGSFGPVAAALHYTDMEQGGFDKTITAVKVSGKAGIASLALTHHVFDDEDVTPVTAQKGDRTRFDASVPVAGIVSAVLRYETTDDDAGFTRIGLQSKF